MLVLTAAKQKTKNEKERARMKRALAELDRSSRIGDLT